MILENRIDDRDLWEETSTPKFLSLAAIRLYQVFLSGNINTQCNFYPTCSRYAFKAIKRTTALQGWFMATDRLMRDHSGLRGLYPYNRQAGHFHDPVEDNLLLQPLFGLLPF